MDFFASQDRARASTRRLIVLYTFAVIGVLVALQYLVPNGGYDEVDTSQMTEYIESGEVESISFIDGDQEIRAVLDDNGKKVMSLTLPSAM